MGWAEQPRKYLVTTHHAFAHAVFWHLFVARGGAAANIGGAVWPPILSKTDDGGGYRRAGLPAGV